MNFFKNLSISRFVISLYGLQVSRSLKTRKAIKSGLQCTTFFSQILCLQVSVLIIHGHCIQLSFSRAQLLSVSLDFFPDLLFYTKIAFRFLEKLLYCSLMAQQILLQFSSHISMFPEHF